MKRFMLFLALLLTSATMMAEYFTIGSFTFRIIFDMEVELYDCENDITSAYIGSDVTYNGTPFNVKSIGESAFAGCSSLTSVTIPNSVTSIGHKAFYGCSSLTSITIPNSVTSIGEWAFDNTAILKNPTNWNNGALYINNCLISVDTNWIGDYNVTENTRLIAGMAFEGCSDLTSVTIPNSVTSIGNGAFYNCFGLTSITIPNSVTSIGESAFEWCSSLKSIIVQNGNPIYDSRENCNAIIETATNTLIAGCNKTIIPYSVTSIGDYAFESCSSLTSVTIPNSVTEIGGWAFEDCSSLTSVTIPNSVTSIGEGAFGGCESLTSVTIPNSVTWIGYGAFLNCSSLTSITIPNSVTGIGEWAFGGCFSLTSVIVPIHTEIEEDAFPEHVQIIRK